ncbi:GIY-YIG nuclease family protein [Sorangium sp. So ce388]|uniref:GIY-YIG nuclease family protein n=1 Tax=Sorangium sp. So ce388 TaxID=3133309 RepID=UPI003F5BC0F0
MPIYFIQEAPDGAIKIGYTGGDPFARLSALQTGNSKPLKLLAFAPGSSQHERGLHERFADLRLHGEWFRPDPRLLGFIEGMRWAFPEEQKRKPTEAPTIYGMTGEQIRFIAGIARGTKLVDEALDCQAIRAVRSGVLEWDCLNVLLETRRALSELGDLGVARGEPEEDGMRAACLGQVRPSVLSDIEEALSRHHMTLAETRAVEDGHAGVHPDYAEEREIDRVQAQLDDELLPHEAH